LIALDTNVLARYLLKDDAAQHLRAVAILAGEDEIWVPITVVLELAWVLKVQGRSKADVVKGLRGVMSIDEVSVQHAELVRVALAWAESGMDIADALHLALSGMADRMVSFDSDLIKISGKLHTTPEVARR
jgi:predicted nucleic-acid-binding protein